jgi:GxxExxY protein
MPVDCPISFKVPSDDEFRKVDFKIMPHAFECHNAIGRLCGEAIYQVDFTVRLNSAGLGPISTRIPVTVSWRDFKKTYYLDMVAQDSLLYELKAVKALTGEHKAQLLNYLLLLGLRTGKLVNFGATKVESFYVSTRLTRETRTSVTMNDSRWKELSPACAALRDGITEILKSIRSHLDLALYEEMLAWLFGGEERVVCPIPLARAGHELGTQKCRMISVGIGFKMTALTEHQAQAESQFCRFLSLTPLRALQWINLNGTQLELVTILRQTPTSSPSF